MMLLAVSALCNLLVAIVEILLYWYISFFLLSRSWVPSFIHIHKWSLISVWLLDCRGSLPGSRGLLYSLRDFKPGGCIRILSEDYSVSGPLDYLG